MESEKGRVVCGFYGGVKIKLGDQWNEEVEECVRLAKKLWDTEAMSTPPSAMLI